MKTKHIPYLILGLIVLLFVIIEVTIFMNDDQVTEDKPFIQVDDAQENEQTAAADYMNDAPEEIVEDELEQEVLDYAEVEPQFPGGEQAMVEFIQENIQYPEIDREMGNEGTVYSSFVVDADGYIKNVKIVKSVPGSVGLDAEVKRVIRKMPKWIPAKQNDENVSVRFTLPIKFTIQ
ncbi:MAG: energy transducer TonB [Crocinitomicaceae bacterium]|nr:energy transducer TonB [Crocinitomicaceae bacterium]MBK8925214.1 energy transducer TonB [Crocinitomicaceae bacterium]